MARLQPQLRFCERAQLRNFLKTRKDRARNEKRPLTQQKWVGGVGSISSPTSFSFRDSTLSCYAAHRGSQREMFRCIWDQSSRLEM